LTIVKKISGSTKTFDLKKSRKKVTLWLLFFNYYTIAFSIVWGILLVPLYLKYIPLNIYGAWLATGNIIAWLTVVDPGISDVLRQQVGSAYGAGETRKLNEYLSSGILLSLIVSLLILIGGFISRNYIIELINLTDLNSILVVKKAFILAVVGSSLLIFSFGFTSFSQGLLSSVGIGMVYVVATISSLVVNVVLLYRGYGLYSIPLSQIVRALILIVGNIGYIIWRYIRESLNFRFTISGLSGLAKLSSYNMLGRLANIMSTQMDTFLVARYLGAEVAPILNLTKKGPELSRMFVERPPIAMLPAITNAWGNGEYDKVRKYTSRLFTIMIWLLGLIFTGFIIFNKSFVTLWVGGKIFAGNSINVVICSGIIILVISNVSSNIFFALGKIKETSTINFTQSIITVLALFIGVKFFGLYGLVLAQVLSLLAFSAWYFPYRTVKFIKYDIAVLKQIYKEITIVILISAVIIIISVKLISVVNLLTFLIFALLVVFVYSFLLFLFSKSFRNEVFNILQGIKKGIHANIKT
jgi:O-antigen/teichoic acid export membrane protein